MMVTASLRSRGTILRGLTSLVAAAIALVVTVQAVAVPEPSPVPRRWQLQIEPGDLRVGTVDIEGEGPQTFYYFTYTVTNRTGEDRYFAPAFDLSTDDGTILRSGRDVPREVYTELMSRMDNELLEDELAIIGQLQQGPENAKEGLVVWRAENLKVDTVKVFAAGFSGETKRYTKPDNGEEVILRKQLMLTYAVPGELDAAQDQVVQRDGLDRWIMR